MVKITALMDDNPSQRCALVHEHGLAYLVEGEGYQFLFDCGQGPHTWSNAWQMGLGKVDAVVLSHSHYDHAGGYRYLVRQGEAPGILYTGERFFEPKFSFDGVKYSDRSAGFDRGLLDAFGICHRVVAGVTEIGAGVWLIGGFPRKDPRERIPARFVRRTSAGFAADDFGDEICAALDFGGKLAMLVGCSHPGILNMARHVRETLDMPIYAIFGGTHLVEADGERVEYTISRLREMGVEVFGLGHCSGEEAEAYLRQLPGVASCHLGAGDCMCL